MMIIKMSMEFELKRCALMRSQRRICCTNYLNMKNMGMRKIQEGCFFLERGTGVCLGATERNGNLENRDREDPETRTVGRLEEFGIRTRIGMGNAGAQGWCC